MVQDLNTWMSDMGDQVVSINVIDSQTSNRYYCKPDPEIIPQAKGCPYIFANTITVVGRGTNTSYFGYQFIGITSSGITVLKTVENGGGSGSFESLLLLKFEQDQQLNSDLKEGKAWLSGKRLLMKKVGQLSLGDRWGGELRVQGNKVVVGKDTGQYSYNTNDMVLDLELVH